MFVPLPNETTESVLGSDLGVPVATRRFRVAACKVTHTYSAKDAAGLAIELAFGIPMPKRKQIHDQNT